jgi:hypothetical protein
VAVPIRWIDPERFTFAFAGGEKKGPAWVRAAVKGDELTLIYEDGYVAYGRRLK